MYRKDQPHNKRSEFLYAQGKIISKEAVRAEQRNQVLPVGGFVAGVYAVDLLNSDGQNLQSATFVVSR